MRCKKIVSIFIVEDDLALQNLYSKVLKIYGFQIIGIANNGLDATMMFQSFSEKPDIILMDHRMPIKNGIEATKEILILSERSKIIFVSADILIKDKALAIGAYSFIKKPFDIEDLIKTIEFAING